MAKNSEQTPAPVSSRPEIETFLERVRALGPSSAQGTRGRLLFALDATMSRQPTWDTACTLQADMFREAAGIGGLDIQLVYFRGLNECRASGWVSDGKQLADLMSRIDCRGGQTQIGKVLNHARLEHARGKVQALVFVGDAMEEAIDNLCQAAGELGILGVPAFMFHEGDDPRAASAFRNVARLTKGVYARFDAGAAKHLRELLMAAAIYATGGAVALRTHAQKTGGEVLRLFQALDRK